VNHCKLPVIDSTIEQEAAVLMPVPSAPDPLGTRGQPDAKEQNGPSEIKLAENAELRSSVEKLTVENSILRDKLFQAQRRLRETVATLWVEGSLDDEKLAHTYAPPNGGEFHPILVPKDMLVEANLQVRLATREIGLLKANIRSVIQTLQGIDANIEVDPQTGSQSQPETRGGVDVARLAANHRDDHQRAVLL
jgi:hypothetical protein